MRSRLTVKEMKRDRVREFLDRWILAVQVHWRRLLIGAGALALAALAVGALLWQRSARDIRAQMALIDILAVYDAPIDPISPTPSDLEAPSFATESDRAQEVRRRFEGLIKDYDGSAAAKVGRAYVASLGATDGGLAEAREIWQGLADGSEDALAATAEMNLIRLDRQEGLLEELAGSLESRIENQESSLPSDVLLFELALTLEELGREDDAQDTLQRLVDEYPRSPYSPQAQGKLRSSPT